MALDDLDSRNVRGEFLRQMAVADGASWVGAIASPVIGSDRASEDYYDLFDVPPLREAKGVRAPETLAERSYTLRNVEYERSIKLKDTIVRRSKLPILQLKLRQLAIRLVEHWAYLLSTLMEDGTSTIAWSPDGEYFYDTDHSIGDSGTQSNDITVDVSAQPCSVHGTATAPSMGEAAYTMLRCFEALWGFKDTAGQPRNEGVMDFLVKVPPTLAGVFAMAAKAPTLEAGDANPVAGMNVRVVPNARLSWTDSISVTVADQTAFMRQEEDGPNTDHLGKGTTFYIQNNKTHFFGVDVTRAAGYGDELKSIYAQMT